MVPNARDKAKVPMNKSSARKGLAAFALAVLATATITQAEPPNIEALPPVLGDLPSRIEEWKPAQLPGSWRPASLAGGRAAESAACAKEGESCAAAAAVCCSGLVCVGVKTSFCAPGF